MPPQRPTGFTIVTTRFRLQCDNGAVSVRFRAASWSTPLKVVSILSTVVMFVAFHFLPKTLPNDVVGRTARAIGDFFPLIFIIPALLFIVSGYEIDRQHIRIGRLLWSTELPLTGLTQIWSDPQAMCKSLRVFGNGGLYSITGVYQNKSLGRYRAFVTNSESAVVLVLRSRTIVVSPENPSAFVDYVRNLFPSVAGQ